MTHCDTPMLPPQGVDSPNVIHAILYDLHKMTEGHQDAVTMAAIFTTATGGEKYSVTKIDYSYIKAI